MKIYTQLFLLAISLFFTTYSQATIYLGTLDWGSSSIENSAFVGYKKDYDSASTTRSLNALIAHSGSGEQRFYIRPFSPDDNITCNIYSRPDTVTMTFNGQAVKMLKFCNNFTDINKGYHIYTPATDKGHSFIINLFKTSTAPVKLTFDGDVLYVPVRGFTKVWNSAGGNAI